MYSIVYMIVLVIKFKSKEKIRSPSMKLNKHFRLLYYVTRLLLGGEKISLGKKEAHFSGTTVYKRLQVKYLVDCVV